MHIPLYVLICHIHLAMYIVVGVASTVVGVIGAVQCCCRQCFSFRCRRRRRHSYEYCCTIYEFLTVPRMLAGWVLGTTMRESMGIESWAEGVGS